MNTHTYSVLVSPNASLPSLHSKNSNTYWDLINAQYETVHEGTKKECERYIDEVMCQLYELDYLTD